MPIVVDAIFAQGLHIFVGARYRFGHEYALEHVGLSLYCGERYLVFVDCEVVDYLIVDGLDIVERVAGPNCAGRSLLKGASIALISAAAAENATANAIIMQASIFFIREVIFDNNYS